MGEPRGSRPLTARASRALRDQKARRVTVWSARQRTHDEYEHPRCRSGSQFAASAAGLDQAAVDFVDLGWRKAEVLLLHQGRRPYDWPSLFVPVLRLGEAEQPVDGMHQS